MNAKKTMRRLLSKQAQEIYDLEDRTLAGTKLRIWRESMLLTQAELAAACGLKTGGAIAQYELGIRPISFEFLVHLDGATDHGKKKKRNHIQRKKKNAGEIQEQIQSV